MANGLFTLKQVNQALRQSAWTGQKTPSVEYLVVAGGGGGNDNFNNGGPGGGGAGGLLTGIVTVAAGTSYTVTVGSGGAGAYADPSGTASSGSASLFGVISAAGGGGGSDGGATPGSGGSGGGGGGTQSASKLGGQGTFGQGNAGGKSSATGTESTSGGGGGGGAGTVGLDGTSGGGGNGGAGIASAISGTVTTYAGGGGAGNYGGTRGLGGVGGGGNGGNQAASQTPTNGSANTGGGGGGGGGRASGASSGGSGIVVISYPDTYAAAASTSNATVTTSGSGSLLTTGTTYLRYAGQTPFALGSNDFTIEMWVYRPTGAVLGILWDFRQAGTNGAYPYLFKDTDNKVYYYVNTASRITSSIALTADSWTHIAVCRFGTTTTMYFNGASVGTWTDTTNYLVGSTGPTLFADNAGGYSFTGNVSNVRIVKGVCVYTGAFTPPTEPLRATQLAGTNISAITGTQTSLLLNTVSGAYAADSSTNSYAPTNTIAVTPPWNALSPFTVTGYKNRVYTWTTSGSITF